MSRWRAEYSGETAIMNSLFIPVTATEFRTSLLHGRTMAESSPCTSAQVSLLSQPLLDDLVKHGSAHVVPHAREPPSLAPHTREGAELA